MRSEQGGFKDEVFILDKKISSSDHFIRYFCFGKNKGPFWVMKRISSKKIGSQPDLLDRLEAKFEPSKNQDLYFLNEVESIYKLENLVKHFDSFELASQWVKVLIKNSQHFENWNYIFELTQISLEAYNMGKYPYAVGTKTLYLLAKHEGYPVEEDFFKNMENTDRLIFVQLLKSPAPSRGSTLREIEEIQKQLYEKLKAWLQNNSDILF